MEQHPVPQQISSYSFKLVGDMTLKQFLELGAGALLAIVIYSTGLPGFLKWPMIAFFALSGAALAFLPFEERPLEEWVIAFFKSIYSPTLYLWTGRTDPSVYFQPEPSSEPVQKAPDILQTTVTQDSPTEAAQPVAQLEQSEQAFLSKVSQMFHSSAQVSVQPTKAPQPVVQPVPVQIPQQDQVPSARTTASPTIIADPLKQVNQIEPQVTTQNTNNAPAVLTVPSSTPTVVEQANRGTVENGENTVFTSVETEDVKETLGQNQPSTNTSAAQFSPEAAPPMPPAKPNIIVGQVMDPEGKIVEGAILEIKDDGGRPVRALRSNKVGHFMIVTPLPDGKYQLITEKEGFSFEPVTFEANGDLIQPVAVRAGQISKNEQ